MGDDLGPLEFATRVVFAIVMTAIVGAGVFVVAGFITRVW
jgi:hypothetical protein